MQKIDWQFEYETTRNIYEIELEIECSVDPEDRSVGIMSNTLICEDHTVAIDGNEIAYKCVAGNITYDLSAYPDILHDLFVSEVDRYINKACDNTEIDYDIFDWD